MREWIGGGENMFIVSSAVSRTIDILRAAGIDVGAHGRGGVHVDHGFDRSRLSRSRVRACTCSATARSSARRPSASRCARSRKACRLRWPTCESAITSCMRCTASASISACAPKRFSARPTTISTCATPAPIACSCPVTQMHQVAKYAAAEGAEPATLQDGRRRLGAHERARLGIAREDRRRSGRALRRARESRADTRSAPTRRGKPSWKRRSPTRPTPDQAKAIDATKADMERARPMDRLVCGDVGYGKTEVAMRAAFKAIADKKQVAVLVPTTLLAAQHYRTFTARFAAFSGAHRRALALQIEGRAEERTLRDLAEGKVDVVIGTHRLLQKDVVFARSRPDRRRRRAALRRDAQGAPQREPRERRRAHALGDADSAHAAHVADGRARPLADPDAHPRTACRSRPSSFRPSMRSCSARSPPSSTAAARCTTCTTASNRSTASASALEQLVPRARIAVGHGQMTRSASSSRSCARSSTASSTCSSRRRSSRTGSTFPTSTR